MRSGFSTEGLAGPVAVGVRVDSYRGGRVLATGIPVWGVRVEATVERSVPSQVTFMAPSSWVPVSASDPLANFGQRVLVSALVEAEGRMDVVPFGWFLVQSWEEREDGVEVTAVDLMQVVADNPAAWPSSPPAGATIASELRRLAGGTVPGAGLPVVFEARDRGIPRSFQWGPDRVEAIRDLCDSYGLWYGVKPDGCLHVWEPASGARPVATYTAHDLLVEALRSSGERVANRWIVAGSPQGDDKVKWTATVSNFAGEFAPDLYGVVSDRREFNAATSRVQVDAAARSYMREALNRQGVRSLGIVFDPRLELGDDINVLVEGEGGRVSSLTGRVQALSAVLDDPAQVMRVDVKELYW